MKNILKTFAIMTLVGNCLYSQVVEVDEVVKLAINNNLQIKIVEDDIKINNNPHCQVNCNFSPQ